MLRSKWTEYSRYCNRAFRFSSSFWFGFWGFVFVFWGLFVCLNYLLENIKTIYTYTYIYIYSEYLSALFNSIMLWSLLLWQIAWRGKLKLLKQHYYFCVLDLVPTGTNKNHTISCVEAGSQLHRSRKFGSPLEDKVICCSAIWALQWAQCILKESRGVLGRRSDACKGPQWISCCFKMRLSHHKMWTG